MEVLQGVWKQHVRPRAVVGYGVKIFLPSPANYVTRSPGSHGLEQRQNIKPQIFISRELRMEKGKKSLDACHDKSSTST